MTTTIDLAASASRGALVALIGQWLKFGLQLVTVMVLARLLTPGDFGSYAMILAIAGLATLLSDFGLSLASMRSTDLSDQQRSNLFWANVALGAAASAAVFLAAGPIASFYDRPELRDLCQVLAITFLVQAGSAQLRAELARRLQLNRSVSCDVVAAAVAMGVAIAVAANGGGAWALLAQQVVAAGVLFLGLIVVTRWRPRRPRRTEGMRELFGFGAHTGGVQLLNYVTANVDTVLLGRFWGASVVGVYSQAYQLFKVPLQQLAAPMTQVAVPVLARVEGAAFRAYVLRAQLVISYGLGGAFITAAAVSIPLLDLMLGSQWRDAPLLFAILVGGGAFQAMGYVYYWIFVSRGLTRIQLRYAVISRTIMVGLLAAGTPFGAFGVATASSVGLALNWLILSVFALPHADLHWGSFVRVSRRPLLLFTSMFAVIFPLGVLTRDHWAAGWQLLALVGGAALWLGLGWLVLAGVRRDVTTIVTTIAKARRRTR